MQDADYGSDLPSVQAELEKQLREHKSIEKFQSSIEKCSSAKNSFHGDELQLYISYLSGVQKTYTDLLMSSKKRQSDLETLMDFVQSATNELIWLSEKEEREITRDWSSKNLNLVEVEQYYEVCWTVLKSVDLCKLENCTKQCNFSLSLYIYFACNNWWWMLMVGNC